MADLNADNHLDIIAYDWYGKEPTAIYYGPNFTTFDTLTIGSHHGFSREIGNVYTREYTETYYSSVFDAGFDVGTVELSWADSCPGESVIKLAVRIGWEEDTTDVWGKWNALRNNDTVLVPIGTGRISRYIQYRAILEFVNPAELPVLEKVAIGYEERPGVEETGKDDDFFPLVVDHLVSGYGWNIKYLSTGKEPVILSVYDAIGSRITTLVNSTSPPGRHEVYWNGLDEQGSSLPPGPYYISYTVSEKRITEKILVIE